ncbi:MAG: hypothetical protein GX137_00730 [Thermoplasmatales archaeon]|jgi:hypothetical protein|nr:hypothetical protein [Thermoplasmatales archaeon]
MNLRNFSFVLALAVLMMSPLALSVESDADVKFGDAPVTVSINFDDMGSGAVTVHLVNDGTEDQIVNITVREYPSRTMATANDILIPAAEDGKVSKVDKELRLGFNSQGEKYLQIEISDGTDVIDTIGFNVSVSHSIWKDSSTYILIIIVVIVIAVVIYLRIRGTAGKKTADQPSKTFTEMEAERKAGKGSKQSGSPKRQRYDKGDRRK